MNKLPTSLINNGLWIHFIGHSGCCLTVHQQKFREYLAISRGYHLPVYSLDDILNHKVDFPYDKERPLLLFMVLIYIY